MRQAPKEGKVRDKTANTVVEQWETTKEDFLQFLTDSLVVYEAFEKILHSADELAPLRSFRCRAAFAAKPSERAQLLASIRREWGSEQAFDRFVRAELPHTLREAKVRHARRIASVASGYVDVAFGN